MYKIYKIIYIWNTFPCCYTFSKSNRGFKNFRTKKATDEEPIRPADSHDIRYSPATHASYINTLLTNSVKSYCAEQ